MVILVLWVLSWRTFLCARIPPHGRNQTSIEFLHAELWAEERGSFYWFLRSVRMCYFIFTFQHAVCEILCTHQGEVPGFRVKAPHSAWWHTTGNMNLWNKVNVTILAFGTQEKNTILQLYFETKTFLSKIKKEKTIEKSPNFDFDLTLWAPLNIKILRGVSEVWKKLSCF